jgi:hypothetical protein
MPYSAAAAGAADVLPKLPLARLAQRSTPTRSSTGLHIKSFLQPAEILVRNKQAHHD